MSDDTVKRRSPNEMSEMISKLDEDWEKDAQAWTDSARRALRWALGDSNETPRWEDDE